MKQNWTKSILVVCSLFVASMLIMTGCERVEEGTITTSIKGIKGSEKIEITANTPHLIGAVELISDGKILHSAKGKEGALVYGPYWPLKDGKYRVRFNLMLTGKPEHFITHIDVLATDKFTQKLAHEPIIRKLNGTDKPKWEEHFIDFTVEKNKVGNQLYEFRVLPTGAGDVRVKEIILEVR